ncbi:MAG: aromatic amino acid ammonia-lyase [Peptoniphilus sp.]|uniref:HAL/PAL/TAL family ammonia-lyase n=1 Tax=Peptoniphilus sp. TaxID=1971214 RepID=UPI0025F6FF1F|nr:aromatic amino acid ammonia-lyase [Peptoniphilus sp.]MCI5642834.1 aromatic amino acid ammonia-lyase [Peptoniphilus sp.]
MINLDRTLTIEEAIKIINGREKIDFSEKAINRVKKSSRLIEEAIESDRPIYGVTTGLGANSNRNISLESAKIYQEKILMSHAVSVGEPLNEQQTRAIMLMIILNGIKGYSGVRISTLEFYKEMLNKNLYPFVPSKGSVGYLNLEAHIGLAAIGKGKFYKDGKFVDSKEVLSELNIKPLELSYKEALFLISGTTSVTAFAILAINDMKILFENYKLISAMEIEVSCATTRFLDKRLMSVRKQIEQKNIAQDILDILEGSEICKYYYDKSLQNALSIRCIPQLMGPVLKKINEAEETVLREMNSCTDNPILYQDLDEFEVISGCNADSSYIGLEMDCCCIAMTMLAKMSERRTFRLLDSSLSNKPAFLVEGNGEDSGLMIVQYTQAGILNEMRINSTPGIIDNIPTSANQEDYVAMGFNSSKKILKQIENLRYIMAIELLVIYQANRFNDPNLKRSEITNKIYQKLKFIPELKEDYKFHPYIERLNEMLKEKLI